MLVNFWLCYIVAYNFQATVPILSVGLSWNRTLGRWIPNIGGSTRNSLGSEPSAQRTWLASGRGDFLSWWLACGPSWSSPSTSSLLWECYTTTPYSGQSQMLMVSRGSLRQMAMNVMIQVKTDQDRDQQQPEQLVRPSEIGLPTSFASWFVPKFGLVLPASSTNPIKM